MTFVGAPSTPDDEVDDVAAQLEHDPAAILGQCFPLVGPDDLAHHRVDLEDLAEPPTPEDVAQQHHGGVVSVHVPHLHPEVLPRCRLEDPPVLGE